ncbi:uncharacterized protein LOC105839143 isoform X2 [Monomorium pharaonis]|uniref:uncharacterized protein LOC105839143 isoform X2 n=1 Tax=Monomorium pharaonis TaxID=307658 RepID=UPI00063F1FD1|nr:uncharacterized protein LOC105839143 isoform X2 [Monomorium pharaonis]
MQNQILEDVRKILLSLLVSRKGNSMPITVLEKEYYDMEGRCIPYRQFGYSDLVLFLQNMPDYFNVVQTNGNYYVYGIASEKSKHVSSMVARQKSDLKKYNITHSRSFNRRYYGGKHQPVRITPDKLYQLMQYIKGIPAGVSLDNARGFVQNLVPYVEVNKEDLRQQLRELSHQLCLDGNMIYPICNDSPDMNQAQPLMKKDWLSLPPHDSQKRNPSKSPSDSASPLNENICAAGQEDSECMYFSDENYFVPAGCRVHNQKRATTCEQLATNIAQYAKNEETDVSYNQVQNEIEIDEEFLMMDSKSKTEIKTQEISDIVSDKIKSRLEELLRKYPEGIWCAQLPDLYLEEYKVRLNYTKLGFTSVREFTSYLPKIFYMTQINKTDDFLLFHAEKRPVVPKTEPIDIVQSSHKQHDEHDTVQAEYNNNDDDAPIPSEISPTITKRFAPDDVMNYDDNVGKISVTELQLTRKFLEIYIIEVFHPSFFWIQLRENVKRFNAMMEELSEFYELNKDTYAIPRVALKKDMHCACVYMNRWHRGLIKRVKPDYRVTVFFYDYGTLKTYPSDEIYYLHKKFSALPAQAIPCGLYNVIPTTGERWKKSVNDQFIDKIADTLLAATIMSVNATDNSMLVVLVDVSEEEDVKINDWLVNERLALIGKTADAVDMANLMKYVVNSSNHLPSYCFAEENPMPDNLIRRSDCKTASTEYEVPLVSPGSTHPCYNNYQPQQSVRPPPGFLPLGDQLISSNVSTRSFYDDYSFVNASNVNAPNVNASNVNAPNVNASNVNASNVNSSNVNAPVFDDTEPMMNPFLTEQFIKGDNIKQMYMSIWNDNKGLQIRVGEILNDLLEHSSLSFQDQTQLNKILKIIEMVLLEQKDNCSTAVKTPPASNFMSGMTSNVNVGSQKASCNLNSETFANQELNANTFSKSNPFCVNNSDRSQSNATFSTYGTADGFSFKTNWSQSSEDNSNVQIPPSTTPSPTPSMFVNHMSPVNTFPPTANQENVPLLMSATPANSSSINFPEMLDNVKIQFANMFKDTNPFKASMTEMQITETQNERTAHNYDANLASYVSATNSQSYASQTETANIYTKSNGFTSAGHVGENYTPKIVYESGPVMYNTQTKQVDVDARLNACSSNHNNIQNAQSLELGQYSMKSASQPVNNIVASQTQSKPINHQMTREQVTDYVTQVATYLQNSQPIINNEPTYYQQNGNVNNLRPLSAQSWNSEQMVNSKFQNSVPLSNHNDITLFDAPSITLSHQDWKCDNNRSSVPQKNEATDSSSSFKYKNNEKLSCTNSWYNTEAESIQYRNAVYNSSFLFQKIDSIKGVTFIFNIEQDGWILTHEFVETFTNLKLSSRLMVVLEALNIKVVFKEIQRSEYPIQFSQLDRYPLNAPRDSEKRIISIHLISLQTILTLLHKLKIISRDEIDKAFKKNEFLEGSVLSTLWVSAIKLNVMSSKISVCY